MKLSGVPPSGLTKTISFGSRRGVSMARKTTGSSKIFGCACTVPRLKKSNSPGPNSALVLSSSIQNVRSEEHTSELQSRQYLVCRLLLEKKKKHLQCDICNNSSLTLKAKPGS